MPRGGDEKRGKMDGISYGYKWDQRTGGWIHNKLSHCYDVILSSIRGQTKERKKNWRQFVFYRNKSSKKSNIAGKNEQKTTKFMPFLN